LGGGDALGSIGELGGARCWAERVAELEGRQGHEVVREVVTSATSLVERYGGDIRDLADVLARRKRISRFDCPVEKILARVRQGQLCAAPLSAAGQALCDKILGAFDELNFLAPLARMAAGDELAEVEPWKA
jgi:hypothetical protein